jgi:peptidoglycan hydrolase-like protein with peptidoglycan-binding domain
MTSARARYVTAGGVIAAVVIALFVSGMLGSGSKASGGSGNAFATSLQTVTRRSLSQQTQVSATLGYAKPSTIVVPAGTAPSSLQQAQQAATTAQAQLATARAALATDATALGQERASLSANRAKQSVDCSGDNVSQSPPSPSTGAGGDSGSGACATDAQAVTTGEQSATEAAAKVAGDRQGVSSATTGLASAETSLRQDESSATVYGQSATYTELPAVGQIVKRGRTLYEISGQPTVLLYGSAAAWRVFSAGMSPGKDVAELNANLRALGYGSTLCGDAFTAKTAAAIDAFQGAHGLSRTGELLLGSVVFEPGPVRVTSLTPTLGATVQPGPVLSITSTLRQVTIALDAAQQSLIKVGDPVTITLPDNRTTPGRVSYVGTVATVPSSDQSGGGGSSSPTIEVDVTPADPAATGHLDQAPVNVSITTASVENALVVPVNALLALASGGYAVEAVGAGGVHHLVGVQLGLFDDADGLVQVTETSLTSGTRVVVPSE